MTQLASEYNPFMLMVNPEIVLAAIHNSERLAQLNSQMCRPLDKLPPPSADGSIDGADMVDADELDA
ncbi:MAG: hypothetical protein ABIN96_14635 [Rubrivivax sp.]